MAAIDDLRSAYAGYAARLKDLSLNPKPDYEVDGQKVSWGLYQEMLLKNMKALRVEIEESDDTDSLFFEDTQLIPEGNQWLG